MDRLHLSGVERVRPIGSRNSSSLNRTMRRIATGCISILAFGIVVPGNAQAAPSVPLTGSIAVTSAAPFIDVNAGTAVTATLSGSLFSSQDIAYLGLTDGDGNVTRRLSVTPDKADAEGNVRGGTTSYTSSTFGAQTYRVWIDLPNASGLRNRIYDANEPTFTGTYTLAGNPAAVTLLDANGIALGESTQLIADTCRIFQAVVKDSNGAGVSKQQLKIRFEDAPGVAPKACSAADLTADYKAAATTTVGLTIQTGQSDQSGKIVFAIKGGKGSPDWSGDVTASVLDANALGSANAKVLMSTNAGGNKAVSAVTPTFASPVTRLSTSVVTLTVTDSFGNPLQGVVLTQARVSALTDVPTSGTDLGATNMLGQTTMSVDTTVLGDRNFIIWANKPGGSGTAGLDTGEVSATATVTVVPQTVSIPKSTFTAQYATVPVDKAKTNLTLTLNDVSGFPVQDVQVDFNVTGVRTHVTLDKSSGVTSVDGAITISASRLATYKTRDTIEVTATVNGSNPVQTIKISFEIQPRAASQISLVAPINRVSTLDGGSTDVEVALQDQFGGPFAGTVSFRSVSGRNQTAAAQKSVLTDAQGHAKVSFDDLIGRITIPAPNSETDSVVAEATTVDQATITSGAVRIFYSPSLQANKMTIGNFPATYQILYGSASVQSLISSTVAVQNVTSSVVHDLYAIPVTATISGPASLLDSNGLAKSSLQLTSDDDGLLAIPVQPSGVAGTVTLTLTSGANSKTATLVVQPNASGARVIVSTTSASSLKSGAPARISAKVTDVFGNTLSGVQVQFLSSGIGRLNASGSLANLCGNGIGTSDQTFGAVMNTDSGGSAYVDLLTSQYESGTATVYAYLGNATPFVTPCGTSYPEATQNVNQPFSGAPAGVSSAGVNVTYVVDTTFADLAKQAAADKAAAQALATQAAADKAAAQALATQAAADKAAAQALATQTATDKAAAVAAADKAATDKAVAQALATQAAADKAAAQALATQAAADKAAAQALATQTATDKAAAQALATQSTSDKVAAQALATQAAADKAAAEALATKAAADKATAQALATQAATDKAVAQALATQAAADKAAAQALATQAAADKAAAQALATQAAADKAAAQALATQAAADKAAAEALATKAAADKTAAQTMLSKAKITLKLATAKLAKALSLAKAKPKKA